MEKKMKATKIVCTLGPASASPEVLRDMMRAGMNVARLNFSHGSHEEHLEKIETFRQVCEEMNLPASILLDTKGPEIRLGTFEHKVLLKKDQLFTLRRPRTSAPTEPVPAENVSAGASSTEPAPAERAAAEAEPQAASAAGGTDIGSAEGVSITYEGLADQVGPGTRILVDDGKIRMIVEEVRNGDIICRVKDEGYVSTKKGVNVPDIHLNLPFLSERDKSDILFGIQQDVDFVAASFVRTEEDVKELRAFLKEHGGDHIKIISKIENPEGIRNFDTILKASDGIMIARGDMGVEVDYATLPGIQKKCINECNRSGKPVITATQMLESMVSEPTPTRAEITDVANAVFDGTSAVMLSGETAAGQFPIQAVQAMTRIVCQAEKDMQAGTDNLRLPGAYRDYEPGQADISTAIGHAACKAAEDIGAKALMAITYSGYTARMMARFHPAQSIIAATPQPRAARQLELIRGVIPVPTCAEEDFGQLVTAAIQGAQRLGLLESGDRIVISAGLPLNIPGNTNMIRVETVK